jgi:hypothetical protein
MYKASKMGKSLKQLLNDIESLKLISANQSKSLQQQSTLINQLTNYANKKTKDFLKAPIENIEGLKKGLEINSVHLQILHEKHKFIYAHINEIYSKLELISDTLSDVISKKKK